MAVADDAAVQAMAAEGSGNGWTGGVTALGQRRPNVPNVGFQLPRVSEDGRYIAYLEQPTDAPSVPAAAAVTGRGLEDVSLWVRQVEAEGPGKMVASGGACWAQWSAKGALLFITYDERNYAALGIFNPASGRVERKAVGLRHMLMPHVSPSGRRAAVVAYGEVPDQAVIFVVDLAQSRAEPGPPAAAESGAQVHPRWLSDDTLVYVQLAEEGEGRLMRWRVGEDRAHAIMRVEAPASIFDAQHMFAAVPEPVSPDLSRYAVYLPGEERVELAPLAAAEAVLTDGGTRGGVWWTDGWFLAARDDRLELVRADVVNDEQQSPQALRLLDGRWVPLWADREAGTLLLAAPASSADELALLQLWVVLSED